MQDAGAGKVANHDDDDMNRDGTGLAEPPSNCQDPLYYSAMITDGRQPTQISARRRKSVPNGRLHDPAFFRGITYATAAVSTTAPNPGSNPCTCLIGMQGSGVEVRNKGVARLDQKPYLGTSEDEPFGSSRDHANWR